MNNIFILMTEITVAIIRYDNEKQLKSSFISYLI
jgi:hypothetical protein